jgi:hypothetical protein
MAKLKVKTSFMVGSQMYNVGDIINVENKNDQTHLINSGQAGFETYDFFKKEEKQVIQTKELKVEVQTKEEIVSEDLESLRLQYLDKFGKEADKRWKEARLLDELK